MLLLTPEDLAAYLATDPVAARLGEPAGGPGTDFVTHRWLQDTPAKRLLFWRLYGDVLRGEAAGRTLHDVGGGVTGLTPALAAGCRYRLVELMAHDDAERLEPLAAAAGGEFWDLRDWAAGPLDEELDLVVANDLFPNVDQRLGPFLEHVLPRCREVRLSLTFYPTPRFYKVRRVDGDEVFHVMAWDGPALARALAPWAARLPAGALEALATGYPESLYPNGRQVAALTLPGDRKD